MKNTYKVIEYDGANYIVAVTKNNEPFVFDESYLTRMPDKPFYKNKNNGYIYFPLYDSKALLHHIIRPYNGVSVDHINQIKTDNREANLRHASQTEQNKNQMKKKRNVQLPDDCGIDSQDIPTFIWYIKGNGNHGDRWMVEIKEKYSWKTTSSKEYTTKLKFELAKKHLRQLIQTQPEIFRGHCINGELNDEADRLKKEYIEILRLAGYEYVDKMKSMCLVEDVCGLTQREIDILHQENDITKEKAIPEDLPDITVPKYCYYIPANDKKGNGFCVGKIHPKLNGKCWTTSRSKKISTQEKYNQLMAFLDKLENASLNA